MTDYKFYDQDDEDDLIEKLRADGVSEDKIVAALVEVDDAEIDNVITGTLTATDVVESDLTGNLSDNRTHADDVDAGPEKPEWSHSKHHILAQYSHNLTVDRGPEVEFVNNVFGVESDTYTPETMQEVRAWQRRKGFPSTGTITLEEYNQLW